MLLSLLKSEIKTEFKSILDWWVSQMTDHENGGFLGRIDGYGQAHPTADKGIILNTRILWTYSKVYLFNGEDTYRELADRAYHYICAHFWDYTSDGVYWLVDYQGNPIVRQKQVYAQAFAIYAFCAYYEMTGSQEVLHKIELIFNRLESHSRDRLNQGYLNVFNEDWTLADNQKLSEKDADQVKIMNTHLHILEAYTALHRVAPNEKYRQALMDILDLYIDHFCSRIPCHVFLYFDNEWQPTSYEKSFGHDVESSWLITEAAEVAGDPILTIKSRSTSLKLVQAVLDSGTDGEGGIFEKTVDAGKKVLAEKHWWPQAEGVVGFLNAWELSGDDKFLLQAIKTWHFIQVKFVDQEKGEWHWLVDQNGQPDRREDKAGPWKAPYHNVRMCLEVLTKLNRES